MQTPARHPSAYRGQSQGTIEATALIALALAGLCRLHGPNARPEDCPQEWTRIVREVREDLVHDAARETGSCDCRECVDEGGEA